MTNSRAWKIEYNQIIEQGLSNVGDKIDLMKLAQELGYAISTVQARTAQVAKRNRWFLKDLYGRSGVVERVDPPQPKPPKRPKLSKDNRKPDKMKEELQQQERQQSKETTYQLHGRTSEHETKYVFYCDAGDGIKVNLVYSDVDGESAIKRLFKNHPKVTIISYTTMEKYREKNKTYGRMTGGLSRVTKERYGFNN